MKILCMRYGGLIARCPNCYAIIGYNPDDVSPTQNIYCPQCRCTLWVPFDPNYDGTIKESEEKKNDSMV